MIRDHALTAAPPNRVVVLGASGFVGRALAESLSDLGIAVISFSSRDLDLSHPDSSKALEDILRPGDTLVFVSAITPDRGRDATTLIRNLVMGQHVSRVLERPTCSHAIYISSDAVYADDAHPVRETSPCHPSTFHGLMHLGREQMLREAVEQSHIPLLILRPCGVYGPDDTHNSYGPNRFVRSALTERSITLIGEGEEQRDHLFSDDLCRLIVLGMLHQSEGVLNAATGSSVSFAGLARLVQGACGNDIRLITTPRRQAVTHRHFDVTARVRAFPVFQPTPLRAGLLSMKEALTQANGRDQSPGSLSTIKAEHRAA